MNIITGTDEEKLKALSERTYKEQAVWFLNAFWTGVGHTEAERLWDFVHQCEELDKENRALGNHLDEFTAHRFLEHFKETLTITDLRDKLLASGAIPTTNKFLKEVPLIFFLIVKYNVDFHHMVNTAQGAAEETAKAQRVLEAVMEAFAKSAAQDRKAAASLEDSTRREAHAKEAASAAAQRDADAKQSAAEAAQKEGVAQKAEQEAKEREAEARAREDEMVAAKNNLEEALKELHQQESAYNDRTAQLTKASQEGSAMAQSKAKVELATHLEADHLPLRKAKVTQEAALKTTEKAIVVSKAAADVASAARKEAGSALAQAQSSRAAADAAAAQASAARASAEQSAKEAVAARAQSEVDKQHAAAALADAKRKVEEAEAFLEQAKKVMPGGTSWWMERELVEARNFLPKAKGGYIKRHMTLDKAARKAFAASMKG